jgi:hypothetical protein
MPPNAWVRLGENGANGGPVPAGRVFHTAGHMGDQLYVYGGITAAGPSSELWAYNLVSQAWGQVQPSMPAPPTGSFGVGTVVGRHLYLFIHQRDNGLAPIADGSGALWRWAPAQLGPPAAGGAAPVNSGHTAGIVIGILIGLGNLYFLVLLVQNAGVSMIPSFSFGGFGGSSKASTSGVAGFCAAARARAARARADHSHTHPPFPRGRRALLRSDSSTNADAAASGSYMAPPA